MYQLQESQLQGQVAFKKTTSGLRRLNTKIINLPMPPLNEKNASIVNNNNKKKTLMKVISRKVHWPSSFHN